MKRFLSMLCLVLISSAFLIPSCVKVKVEPPVINSFDASPPSISTGESSTLNWDTSGATSVSIDQGIGSVAVTGTRAIAPSTTTTYTLTATNAGGSVAATTQVMVSETPTTPEPAGMPVISSFTASPPGVTAGDSATLSWNVSNATSVAIGPGVGNFASSGTTLVSPATTTTYTLTATNEAGSSTATAQVIVSPEVYTPPPEYTPPPITFAVTSVTASVAPPSFSGACPKNFSCSAVIAANAAGTVTYRWERSDGGSSPTQTVNFASAGSQTVTTGWPREASGAYWVRVRTLTPNEVVSNQADFNLTCEAPFAVTKVQAKSAPASGTRTCPFAINYTYDITTNGPGTVTYHFEQSNGATSSTKTLNFSAAGTQTVSHTWTVSSSGTYSVRCRALTPNDMSGNSVPVTVTCE